MRAWVVEGNGEPVEVLALRDLPQPEPAPGFVRLRVAAAGIGLPDVLMCRGTYPLTPPGSFVAGQELAGVVNAVGPGGDRRLLGRRRMGVTAFYTGHGAFAEEALAAQDTLWPAPDWLRDADAAGFHIPFYTAWVGLRERAALVQGETLVVLGAAGGTGAAAVSLGHALGAQVIAVAGGADKASYCRALGADVVVDHRVEDVPDAVLATTAGKGADVVFDPVGGTLAEAMARAMAHHGRFLLVGFASGRWPALDAAAVVQRNFAALGVYAGAYDRAHAESAHAELLALVKAGSLASTVTTHVPFDDLPAVLSALADRSMIGKAILLPPGK